MLSNYHNHCDFCDGKTSAKLMAEAAYNSGISSLGFSSHAPLPFYTGWNMDIGKLDSYISTIYGLAEYYKGKMDILCGLEIDYIDGLCGPNDKAFNKPGIEYKIASVHYVIPKSIPKEFVADVGQNFRKDFTFDYGFTVDEPESSFAANFYKFYDGNKEAFVEAYYTALKSMIDQGGFDILGHFDLIKKNNRTGQYFDDSSEHYRSLVMMVVDALRSSNIIVEINTGAMKRYGLSSPYPDCWILKELHARKIDICINSDAHSPEQLLSFREHGLKTAYEAGFRRLVKLEKPGRAYSSLA